MYFLSSESYVPDRLLKKIDKATSSMVENGLSGFYRDFMRNIKHIRKFAADYNENTDYEAVQMKNMIRPLLIHFVFLGMALVLFILEIYINRANQNIYSNMKNLFKYFQPFSK